MKILKKSFQLTCKDKIFRTLCSNFLKIILPNKIINKTRTEKNQENFAHRFGKNHLINHLPEFLQDTIINLEELSSF